MERRSSGRGAGGISRATGVPDPRRGNWHVSDGQEDWPVSGVSWYEAAAYAKFAGKSLPTVYQWQRASGAFGIFSEVVRFSNFGGKGPARVGGSGGLGPYGTYDMPGNVKEWTWNESGQGRRYVLGGAWYEPVYSFHDADARLPFERGAGFGFRCVRQPAPLANALTKPIVSLERDPAAFKPGVRALRAYRRSTVTTARADSRWTSATTRFRMDARARLVRTAYGRERVPVMLFLPRARKPPYQVVMYSPFGRGAVAQQPHGLHARLEFLVTRPPSRFRSTATTIESPRPRGQNFLREVSIQRGRICVERSTTWRPVRTRCLPVAFSV